MASDQNLFLCIVSDCFADFSFITLFIVLQLFSCIVYVLGWLKYFASLITLPNLGTKSCLYCSIQIVQFVTCIVSGMEGNVICGYSYDGVDKKSW